MLHTEPHVRPVSCHITSLLWQELEEELNHLFLMKVSGRDKNIKVKMSGCVEVIVSFCYLVTVVSVGAVAVYVMPCRS